jgi:pilus assembly protein Flp/PilA
MPRLKTSLKAFFADCSGATAIEYALIGSLLSVVIIASVIAINGSLTDVYEEIREFIVPALEGTSN